MNQYSSGLHPASAAADPRPRGDSNPTRYNSSYPAPPQSYSQQPYNQQGYHQQPYDQQPYSQQSLLGPENPPQQYYDGSRPSMRRASISAPAPPYPISDQERLLQPPFQHGAPNGPPVGGRPRAYSGASHHSTHSNHSTRSTRSHDGRHHERHEHHHHGEHDGDRDSYSRQHGQHHHHHSHHGEDERRPEHRKRHHSDAGLQRRDTQRPTLGDTVFSVWDTVKSALGPRDKY